MLGRSAHRPPEPRPGQRQPLAGVIVTRKFIYDLWGDTVNVANRITTDNQPGVIQVDARTYQLLAPRYDFEPAQTLNLKGKGATPVYRLNGRRGPSVAAD